VRLSNLICSSGTSEISHTKLWTNIAYLAATIAFLRANWGEAPASPEIWLYYLGVVGGHGAVSKLIAMKYGEKHDI